MTPPRLKLGLQFPLPALIKELDNRALATERRDLLTPTGHQWSLKAEPFKEPILPLAPAEAERVFLTLVFAAYLATLAE